MAITISSLLAEAESLLKLGKATEAGAKLAEAIAANAAASGKPAPAAPPKPKPTFQQATLNFATAIARLVGNHPSLSEPLLDLASAVTPAAPAPKAD